MVRKFVLMLVAVSFLFAVPAFAAEPIRIGQIATVTGEGAPYGVAEMLAVRMAVDEINAAGGILGRPVELIMYDNRSNHEDMINSARRLLEHDNVVAVIGPSFSGLNIAAAPFFHRAQVPHIATLSTNPLVTVDEDGNTRPFNFRICFLDPYQGHVLAYFAYHHLGRRRAALLTDVASDYSQGLSEYFEKSFTSFGGEIVVHEFCRSTDVDFRAQLTNIGNSDKDIVVFTFLGTPLPLAVRQARELGIEEYIIGGDGFGEFMWGVAGDTLRNTFWVSHVDRWDPNLVEFFERFEYVTGTEALEFMNVMLAYDSMLWLKDAIERAGSTDPIAIRDALAATTDLQLTHTVLTMDHQHNPKDKDAVMLRACTELQRTVYHVRISPQ